MCLSRGVAECDQAPSDPPKKSLHLTWRLFFGYLPKLSRLWYKAGTTKEVIMKSSDINVNKLVAEFIGTFILTFAVLASINNFFGTVATSIVAGFALFLSVLAIGAVSGSHINPAVTVALYSIKKIDLTNAVMYIVVQLLGGLAAMVVMNGFLPDGMSVLDAGEAWDGGTILAEAFGAGFFLFGIVAAIKNKLEGGSQAGLIGGALTLGIVFAAAGGSLGVLNPAVAAGLGVFNFSYVVGPIIGAVIGANLYMYFVADKK